MDSRISVWDHGVLLTGGAWFFGTYCAEDLARHMLWLGQSSPCFQWRALGGMVGKVWWSCIYMREFSGLCISASVIFVFSSMACSHVCIGTFRNGRITLHDGSQRRVALCDSPPITAYGFADDLGLRYSPKYEVLPVVARDDGEVDMGPRFIVRRLVSLAFSGDMETVEDIVNRFQSLQAVKEVLFLATAELLTWFSFDAAARKQARWKEVKDNLVLLLGLLEVRRLDLQHSSLDVSMGPGTPGSVGISSSSTAAQCTTPDRGVSIDDMCEVVTVSAEVETVALKVCKRGADHLVFSPASKAVTKRYLGEEGTNSRKGPRIQPRSSLTRALWSHPDSQLEGETSGAVEDLNFSSLTLSPADLPQ